MTLVFNELSARMLASSKHEGREWMDGLIRGIAGVAAGRHVDLIGVGGGLNGILLSQGYSVANWAWDRDVDYDLRRFAIAMRFVDIDRDLNECVRDKFYLSDFRLEGAGGRRPGARDLGLAYLLDGIAASLPSEEPWRSHLIGLVHTWLDSEVVEGTEKVVEEQESVKVRNVSTAHHGRVHADAMAEAEVDEARRNPATLSRIKGRLFPHLMFGREVGDQINDIAVGNRSAIVTKLWNMNQAVREWRERRGGEFVLPGVRPESEATMSQFGHLRMFTSASGKKETFELHVSAGAYRIHFREIKETKSVEIGYVGLHLPTKKYH